MEYLFSKPQTSKKPLEETASTDPGQCIFGCKKESLISDIPVIYWSGNTQEGFGSEVGFFLVCLF